LELIYKLTEADYIPNRLAQRWHFFFHSDGSRFEFSLFWHFIAVFMLLPPPETFQFVASLSLTLH